MLDKTELNRLNQIAMANGANAKLYAQARNEAARCKYKLDVLIAKAYLDGTIERKTAYEKAFIVVGNQYENEGLYRGFCQAQAKYKGLEKVIEANQNQIMLGQSMMRYIRENE